MSTLPDDQQMARVNTSDDLWQQFRALAVTKKRSVADYLGHLVRRELGRASRVEERRERRSKSVEPGPADQEVDETWIPPWEI